MSKQSFDYAAYYAKSDPPPNAKRCTICGLFIFNNKTESGNVPYYPTVNHAIGDLCIGCAGGDESEEKLLIMVSRIEQGLNPKQKENHMPRPKKNSNGLYLEMEIGVMPPATGGSSRGQSKYQPMEDSVLMVPIGQNGKSEWFRFKMETRANAVNASTWFYKRAKEAYRPDGHDLNRRVVRNSDETAWLYMQRIKLDDKEKS